MDDTHDLLHGPAAAAAGAPEAARYEQDLSRSIGILGNVFITLSGVTPASSVFIIVSVALVAAATPTRSTSPKKRPVPASGSPAPSWWPW